MKTKTVGLLILVVVLPTALLSWGGYQLALQQSAEQANRLKSLFRDQLVEIDSRISRYFTEQEASLQQRVGREFPTLSSLREVIQSTPVIDNVFILNPNNTLAFPNPVSPLNQREREFYGRIKAIVDGGDIQDLVLQAVGKNVGPAGKKQAASSPSTAADTEPASNLPAELALPQTQSKSASRRQRQVEDPAGRQQKPVYQLGTKFQLPKSATSINSPGTPEKVTVYEPCSGWFTWYWGRGLNLIYWQRISNGTIVCAALDRSAWMSDLIAELPETLMVNANRKTALETESDRKRQRVIRMMNANNQNVYQWGPGDIEDLRWAAEIPVSNPINAWRLQIWVDSKELAGGSGVGLNILVGIVASTVALIAVVGIFVRETTKELGEATRRVSFVNQVSHELRTPLTNIRMYAELLGHDLDKVDGLEAEAARKRLQVVEAESERLTRLIGNVLTFAGSQKNNIKLHPRAGVVDDCIRDVVSQFQPNLDKLGIEIELDLYADASVEFDSDVVEQVLGNLIGNVEKYAAEGKSIWIQSTQSGDQTAIRVCDCGPGIPSRFSEKIFEPFWRISNAVSQVSGTGIGLSISRELARMHGGDLSLEVPTGKLETRVPVNCKPVNCKPVNRKQKAGGNKGACFVLKLKTDRVNQT